MGSARPVYFRFRCLLDTLAKSLCKTRITLFYTVSVDMRPPERETLLNAMRKRKGMTQADLAAVLKVTTQTVNRYCLPHDHKNHVRPGKLPAERLKRWSGGRIHLGNYSDPYDPKKHGRELVS